MQEPASCPSESLMSSHFEPNGNPWGSGWTEDGGAESAGACAVLCAWLVLILTANRKGRGPLASSVSRQAAGEGIAKHKETGF